MRDFWTQTADKSDKDHPYTPVSIQLVRQRLRDYIQKRLEAVKTPVFDLVDEKNSTLLSRVSDEVEYYIQRMGGDSDTSRATEVAARELGSDVVVDVPQP